jgi:hypothetical protein
MSLRIPLAIEHGGDVDCVLGHSYAVAGVYSGGPQVEGKLPEGLAKCLGSLPQQEILLSCRCVVINCELQGFMIAHLSVGLLEVNLLDVVDGERERTGNRK